MKKVYKATLPDYDDTKEEHYDWFLREFAKAKHLIETWASYDGVSPEELEPLTLQENVKFLEDVSRIHDGMLVGASYDSPHTMVRFTVYAEAEIPE